MRSGGAVLSGLLLLLATSKLSEASGIELALFTGPAIPTYKQTFSFAGGSPRLGVARLTVNDSPSLDATGGLSFGASATFFLASSFGLEVRMDSADVDLQSFGGDYTLALGSAAALPLTLGDGQTDLRRVRPISVNLRLQSQGRVGVGLSGGVSFIPRVDLEAQPTLTVANLNATIPVSLTASPSNPDETRHLGFNAGFTIQVKIAKGFSLVGEARGFTFKRSELKWQAQEAGSLSDVEAALVGEIADGLELPLFTPGFWTARVGVALRF